MRQPSPAQALMQPDTAPSAAERSKEVVSRRCTIQITRLAVDDDDGGGTGKSVALRTLQPVITAGHRRPSPSSPSSSSSCCGIRHIAYGFDFNRIRARSHAHNSISRRMSNRTHARTHLRIVLRQTVVELLHSGRRWRRHFSYPFGSAAAAAAAPRPHISIFHRSARAVAVAIIRHACHPCYWHNDSITSFIMCTHARKEMAHAFAV